jgi:DNA-binding SARP family transcriptional activator
MKRVEVHLLGPPSVYVDGTTLHIARRQTRALLFRLAAVVDPVPREHLCFLLWSNRAEQEARRNLSHLLTHLRSAVPVREMVIVNDDYVALDPDYCWSDVTVFLRARNGCDVEPDLARLHEMVDIYRGPLLAGFSLPGSPEYESWLTLERQSLERIYLETLAMLIEVHIARGNYAEAIAYANNYLFVNSFDEEMHRRLIELYGICGDRGAALHQYQQCAETLRRELGIRPGQDTQEIYLRVLRGQVKCADVESRVEERMRVLRHHRQHRPMPEYAFLRSRQHTPA